MLTGQEVQHFKGHSFYVTSIALSTDVKWMATGSYDGTTRIWHQARTTELCRLFSFRDGTWAVVDPLGRYDAANGGNTDHLHCVVDNRTLPLKQFADSYYDPGLLAKHLGFHPAPPRKLKGAQQGLAATESRQ